MVSVVLTAKNARYLSEKNFQEVIDILIDEIEKSIIDNAKNGLKHIVYDIGQRVYSLNNIRASEKIYDAISIYLHEHGYDVTDNNTSTIVVSW